MSFDEPPFEASLTVPGRIDSVRPAAAFLVKAARGRGIPAVEQPLFEVAIVEALNNALMHNSRDGEEPLHCELDVQGNRLRVRILDEAARSPVVLTLPLSPAPAPLETPESWSDIPESGYGLHLIHAVFPQLRPITRDGMHGIEMELTF